MHISQVLNGPKPLISFEFFPPRSSDASESLFQTIKDLMGLRPSYVSVTYGAGGSTRQLTHNLIVKLRKETELTIVSHLNCGGATRDEIKQILEIYNESGIENIMALRGDPPAGEKNFIPVENGFCYAYELVNYIKKHFPHMGVGIAGYPEGHPETPNRLMEIDYLKLKVDQGADYICTQMFFDNRDFYDFKERCELTGIKIPIIAGIMPITSQKNMNRMAELAQGCRFPSKLIRAIARADDDEHAAKVGIHWATEQVLDLIDNGVRGVHFYTLNKSNATLKIYDSLGVSSSDSFH